MPKKVKGFTTTSLHSRGFTLVELLVVISIISILATVGLVIYRQVFKNSRDAKRQSDLKLLQSAFEQYRVDQGFYPPAINFDGSSLTNATGQNPPPTVTRTYLSKIPTDPVGTTQYLYKGLDSTGAICQAVTPTGCVNYCLYSAIENSANAIDTACTNDTTRTLEVTKP